MNQTELMDQRWSLMSMQVVNWGGFNGHKTIRFAPPGEATVISGKTGSGKSTLMDANTVLINPGKRLNRASNDNVGTGRSLLSYMRGHLDKTITATGVERLLMLRGEHLPTWSAIAQTWRGADGSTFTVFGAFHARPGDAKPVRRYGYHPGEFDLANFEPFVGGAYAGHPLRQQSIRKEHPEIEFVAGPEALQQWLFDTLGVPNAGRGLTDTLYRIQTAGAIGSVHHLFESLVLDKPTGLIDLVNRSREQWDEAQVSFDEVADREKKAQLLEPIEDDWRAYVSNRDQGSFFDTVGPSATPAKTPFWAWVHTRRSELYDVEEQQLTGQWRAAQANAKAAKQAHDDARTAWLEADRAFHAAGGADVEQVNEKLRITQRLHEGIQAERRALSADLDGLIALPDSNEALEQQRRDCNSFLADHEARLAEVEKPLEEVSSRLYAEQATLAERREQRAYYAGRRDLVPPRHDQIRNQYAEASGIPAAELKFVGELVDMAQGFEEWRTAAELALGGFTLTLLVPAAKAEQFRRAVDGITTDVRINSQAVPEQPMALMAASPERLAGRFSYREHRFAGWLSARLATQFDHFCVTDADGLNDLAKGERGITISGQIRDGQRGAHGGQNARRARIGFSPQHLVRDLDAEIAQLELDVAGLQRERALARGPVDRLAKERRAHEHFLRAAQQWHRYDEAGVRGEVETLRERVQALLADDKIARLKAQVDKLGAAEQVAGKHANDAEKLAEELQVEREAVIEAKDVAIDALDDLGQVELGQADADRLDAEALEKFGVQELGPRQVNQQSITDLVKHLEWRQRASTKEADVLRERLVTVFASYLREWPTVGLPKPGEPVDPDLFFEQFSQIRAQNSLTGLPEAKEKFARNVQRFTTMAASSVQESYAAAKNQIAERLGRINTLLAEQPFGPGGANRLRIETLRDQMPDETAEFLTALSGLGSYTTQGLDYDEIVERYGRFNDFMALVATDADVERLFDVRKHVYLHALETRADGADPITHDTFGEKSGGEYQELCAFVLAAAVRYQVGSDATLPRFAPVFLDEGLIKADPEVTERAVNVWKRLGFQPIIAVPLDKHESVMVASAYAWIVSKDGSGRSRVDHAERVSTGATLPTGDAVA